MLTSNDSQKRNKRNTTSIRRISKPTLLCAALLAVAACGSQKIQEQQAAPTTISTLPAPQVLVAPPVSAEASTISQPRSKSQAQTMIDSRALASTSAVVSGVRPHSFQAPQYELSYTKAPNTENYSDIDENGIKRVATNPISTFSIDVDTAAYSNIRRMLMREGRLPPSDAVRLEEMVNYFDYSYTGADNANEPLAIQTETTTSPWNPNNKLLMVGIKGYEPALDQRPDANLVFLVDVSGSMQAPDKLGLVKKSLRLLVQQMTPEDRIALVVYAGAAGMVLDSTAANDKSKILNAIEALTAGGSTNGSAGINLAYSIAEEHFIEGGVNRIIIASDGDMNVGITGIDELKELIEDKRKSGIALTTLGFGAGNYNYSLMEQIADVGNGNASYIDSMAEAQKVLIEEMGSTLLTIAKDVKIQLEFNPAVVAEYRLIGYENRALHSEDFRNDKVDAGEIGAGHTVTALYEIVMTGSDSALLPQTRYGQPAVNTTALASQDQELGFIKVRYKLPEENSSKELGQAIANTDSTVDQASEDIRFAAAVVGFGQILRGGKYVQDWGFDEALNLARSAKGNDQHGYRGELIRMVQLAKAL